MNQPRVTVIILNWNGLKDTIECLESIKRTTYANYEVVVVDNGSRGNDAQVLKEKFGNWAHIIENDKNYGFCGGNNIAIRYALDNLSSDYLMLLNNDTIVDPELISELVKVAEVDPVIGIVGPRMYYYDDPDRWHSVLGKKADHWKERAARAMRAVMVKIRRVQADRQQPDLPREVDWVIGTCFLISGKGVEDIGLLDENFFCYMEEIDYCTRARKAGYKIVYIPEAKFWHKFKRSSKKVTGFSCYYAVRNRFRLMRKHATQWQYWWFMIYFFGFHFWLATGYYLVFHRSSKLFLAFYRGVRDGMSGSKAMARFYSEE
ncbi:glycosyltransferase family 2 protein [Chloroflexota bacterium]